MCVCEGERGHESECVCVGRGRNGDCGSVHVKEGETEREKY